MEKGARSGSALWFACGPYRPAGDLYVQEGEFHRDARPHKTWCGLLVDSACHVHKHLLPRIQGCPLALAAEGIRHQAPLSGALLLHIRMLCPQPGVPAPRRGVALHVYRLFGEGIVHFRARIDDRRPPGRHTHGLSPASFQSCGGLSGHRGLPDEISCGSRPCRSCRAVVVLGGHHWRGAPLLVAAAHVPPHVGCR